MSAGLELKLGEEITSVRQGKLLVKEFRLIEASVRLKSLRFFVFSGVAATIEKLAELVIEEEEEKQTA